MNIYVVRSGSKGNATLVEHDNHLLLIDMGTSLKSLKEGLNKIGKGLMDIEAMLLTHDHSDHTKGINYLAPLPIYCGKGSYDASNCIDIEPFNTFTISCFKITPIRTAHDAINPLGFVIEADDEKLAYVTDTGYLPNEAFPILSNATYYVFESNYDYQMLLQTGRPIYLINRIASDKGHLSNVDSANYLCDLVGPNTKDIIYAHISLESNNHDMVMKTHKKVYKKRHLDVSKINIQCASQFDIVSCGANPIK